MTADEGTVRTASRFWWIFLLRGVAGLLLGASVLFGGQERPRLATFIALYWLAGALLTIRWVLANRWRAGSKLALAAAIAGTIAAGLVLMREVLDRAVSPRFTLDMLGVAAILTGLLRLFGAFHEDDQSIGAQRRWKRIVLGSLEVVLGVLLVLIEDVTPVIVAVVAVWAVVGGTILLLDSVKLRGIARGAP